MSKPSAKRFDHLLSYIVLPSHISGHRGRNEGGTGKEPEKHSSICEKWRAYGMETDMTTAYGLVREEMVDEVFKLWAASRIKTNKEPEAEGLKGRVYAWHVRGEFRTRLNLAKVHKARLHAAKYSATHIRVSQRIRELIRRRTLREIYSDELEKLRQGHAVWNPRPVQRPEGQTDPPVSIGDVGYFDEGQWIHLFNIHREENHQKGSPSLPDKFEVVPLPEGDTERIVRGPRHLSSATSTSASIDSTANTPVLNVQGPSFSVSFETRASLVYFCRAETYKTRYMDKCTCYAVEQLSQLEKLVEKLHKAGIPEDRLNVNQLVIVYECTLAQAWIRSVTRKKTSKFSLGATVTAHAGPSVSLSVSFTKASMAPSYDYDYGPYEHIKRVSEPTSDGDNGFQSPPPPNIDDFQGPAEQCLFIKGVQLGRLTDEEKRKFSKSKTAGKEDGGGFVGRQDSETGGGGAAGSGGGGSGSSGDSSGGSGGGGGGDSGGGSGSGGSGSGDSGSGGGGGGTQDGGANTGNNNIWMYNDRSGTGAVMEAGLGLGGGDQGDVGADEESPSDDIGRVDANIMGDDGSGSENGGFRDDDVIEYDGAGDEELDEDNLPGISVRLEKYSDAEIAVVRDHDLRPYLKRLARYGLSMAQFLSVSNSIHVEGSLSRIDEDLLYARSGRVPTHSDVLAPGHTNIDSSLAQDPESDLILFAGEILGITRATEFSVYSSQTASYLDEPIGRAVVLMAGGTKSTMKFVGGDDCDLGHDAVAIRTSEAQDIFLVSAVGDALTYVRTALEQQSTDLRSSYGLPQLTVVSNAEERVNLIVNAESAHGTIQFLYPRYSNVYSLGLRRLHLSVPQHLKRPELTAVRVRDVLLAGAHFFKYLTCEPKNHLGVLRGPHVQATLHELAESDDFVMVGNRIDRSMQIVSVLEIDPVLGAYKVRAGKPGIVNGGECAAYGVQLVNNLEHDLFVWMFFFDCSTLEIRTVTEPRTAVAGSGGVASVPGRARDQEPRPAPLNFGSGGNRPFVFHLDKGQSLDVGFLRIFISTSYGDLSSIAQDPPVEGYEEARYKREQGTRGTITGRKTRNLGKGRQPISIAEESSTESLEAWTSELEEELGLWDVITLPLVQQAHWD
ncbi:hypothetical protein K488DRAFT_74374 [Vararia minispora EC-137]|uniref:Uncharacterized protein n=1 Tax=Vararia minispora EC-137 TaxID=1314806 RepID=A0ACB8Q7H5_9AGAM|nr:hypothetical protein K488DRAFT_74374 [Vararia minispora EC-137]